jgi:uncharacterized membrane protein
MKKHLRNTLLAGIFAAIPLAATGFVIWYIESQTRALFRIDIPFVGLAIAIASIYILGLIVSSLIGKWILKHLDRLLSRLPVLRELYSAWKQVALTPGGSMGMFARVAMVSDASGGLRTLAFTSGDGLPGDPGTTCIFIPAAPNPTSGRLHFVPLSSCHFIDVSTEEAFKMILSGGNYIPPGINAPAHPTV